jgi:uncharacterized membrane protein
MSRTSPAVIAGSCLIGAASGLRSQMGMAAVILGTSPEALPSKLRGKAVTPVAVTFALGELVVDKLPFTPKRTDIGPLIGRMIFGAGVAGAAAAGEGESIPLATGVGALGAAWGSFAATGARLSLAERGIPSPLVGLLEDVLAMALTAAALGKRTGTIV